MEPEKQIPPVSKAAVWSGIVVSGAASVLLLMAATMSISKPPDMVKQTVEMGYPESTIRGIGIALLVSVVLYAIPRTAVLGAILLTGYLGGAVATHVQRVDKDGVGLIFVPIVFGAMIWLGILLRDARLRALLPLRSRHFAPHQGTALDPAPAVLSLGSR